MPSILLVDDDEVFRRTLAEALRIMGHMVALAEDGQGALAALRSLPIDVMILDLAIPVVDGFQVLAAIRHYHDLPKPPVIVLSAVSDRTLVERAIRLGACDFVIKSLFTLQVLGERIDRALDSKRAA